MDWPAWRKELYAAAITELESWKRENAPSHGGGGQMGDLSRDPDGTLRSRSGKELHPNMANYDNVAVVGDDE